MSGQQPSRVTVVVDRLLELLRAAAPLAGVQVLDGPALSMDQVENDSICVGPGTPDAPGVFTTVAEQPGLGPNVYVEQVEVVMAIQSYSGDVDAKPVRDRAAALLAGVKSVVDDHQVVDQVWDAAALGPEQSWHPMVGPSGATCAIGFTLVFRSVI